MKVNLEQLEEMQKELFRQQCDLDIQKAMVKHFIKKQEAAISVTRCCEELKCDCGNTEDVKNIPICASCYNPHTGEW
jgi:phosphopantothenoylcysteine synthetase/decarboxylase|tara:strand:+ start:160 stop:390 length:231 start_codon:yes stop_codon:yes gene_type:complete